MFDVIDLDDSGRLSIKPPGSLIDMSGTGSKTMGAFGKRRITIDAPTMETGGGDISLGWDNYDLTASKEEDDSS